MDNPYLEHILAALPRLLARFDDDLPSPTVGCGDRFYWGWKLIDFPNGTYQGAVHGLARLWADAQTMQRVTRTLGISRDRLRERIERIASATFRMADSRFGLWEAFPYEGSYCVTTLVLYDHLAALESFEAADAEVDRARWLEGLAPLATYAIRFDEHHAIISNHLASAAAALLLWYRFTGDARARSKAELLIERILTHQSPEGWFSEYGGPDPGYETLGLGYWAEVDRLTQDRALRLAARSSLTFLQHFVHPDGSLGGLYGSRKTRVYYPAGVVYYRSVGLDPAPALEARLRRSIREHRVVTLAAIDPPNLVPLFNAYARAATSAPFLERDATWSPPLPEGSEARFPDAGLLVRRDRSGYTVLSWVRGGAFVHVPVGSTASLWNPGITARRGDRWLTGQYGDGQVRWLDADTLEIRGPLRPLRYEYLDPRGMVLLRLLAMSLFRSTVVREFAKRQLVARLILPPPAARVSYVRRIRFGSSGPEVEDRLVGSQASRWTIVSSPPRYHAGHMASQGYWVRMDDGG